MNHERTSSTTTEMTRLPYGAYDPGQGIEHIYGSRYAKEHRRYYIDFQNHNSDILFKDL